MTVTINKDTDLVALATVITGGNSEIYSDEVDGCVLDLANILNTAETFGIPFTAPVSDWWGGHVIVTAQPSHRQHHWSF